jgi:Flp pilus assembly pilin Flp
MKRAQSILEYSLLVAIVASALTLMYVYLQRSIQANLKAIETEINAEVNT